MAEYLSRAGHASYLLYSEQIKMFLETLEIMSTQGLQDEPFFAEINKEVARLTKKREEARIYSNIFACDCDCPSCGQIPPSIDQARRDQ